MMPITLNHYLILSVLIFTVGIFGVLVRRNLLIILMCVELMLSAANIALVAFSKYGRGLDGHVIVLFVFVIAACEAAVGLGLIVSAFRQKESVSIDLFKNLKG